MKKQYLVMAQHRYQVEEGRWVNVRKLTDGGLYYERKSDAQAAVKRYLAKWNKVHTYGPDGKRRETDAIGGGFAADMIIDSKLDNENMVVAWKIKCREVTDWEEVESKKI